MKKSALLVIIMCLSFVAARPATADICTDFCEDHNLLEICNNLKCIPELPVYEMTTIYGQPPSDNNGYIGTYRWKI